MNNNHYCTLHENALALAMSKEGLDVGDFRLQSFEATDKWFAVALLGLNYLQYQQAQHYVQTRGFCSLAECLRQHRLTH